jgi:cell division transport system ATP-binding protein
MELDLIIDIKEASIYQKDQLIVSNIDLKVSKGDFIYLIGKVGSGKTSILKTLYAELPLRSGTIEVAGFSVNGIRTSQIPYLRRRIGIVFQDFQLLTDRSVFENLNFVLKATGWKAKNEIRKRIQDVLEKVKLLDKMFVMPNELSGGEQQRVAIARALLNDPEVILADEPTGNLDPATSEEILQILMDISHTGRAVMIATHDYPLIQKFPSTIYKCENQRLAEVSAAHMQNEDELLSRFRQKQSDD